MKILSLKKYKLNNNVNNDKSVCDSLHKIMRESFNDYDKECTHLTSEKFAEEYKGLDVDLSCILTINGEIKGAILIPKNDDVSDNNLYVSYLVVVSSLQKKGYGRQLFKGFLECINNNRSYIRQHYIELDCDASTKLNEFYCKLGFEQRRTKKNAYKMKNGNYHDAHCMRAEIVKLLKSYNIKISRNNIPSYDTYKQFDNLTIFSEGWSDDYKQHSARHLNKIQDNILQEIKMMIEFQLDLYLFEMYKNLIKQNLCAQQEKDKFNFSSFKEEILSECLSKSEEIHDQGLSLRSRSNIGDDFNEKFSIIEQLYKIISRDSLAVDAKLQRMQEILTITKNNDVLNSHRDKGFTFFIKAVGRAVNYLVYLLTFGQCCKQINKFPTKSNSGYMKDAILHKINLFNKNQNDKNSGYMIQTSKL